MAWSVLQSASAATAFGTTLESNPVTYASTVPADTLEA